MWEMHQLMFAMDIASASVADSEKLNSSVREFGRVCEKEKR